MKTEKPAVRYLVLVFLCLLAAAVIVAFPLFFVNELDAQTQGFLNETARKNSSYISLKFQTQTEYLYGLSESVDIGKISDLKSALESIGKVNNTGVSYKRYGIAYINGKAYTSDGKDVLLTDTSPIVECIVKDKLVVTRLPKDETIDGDEVFVMHTPLKDGTHTAAVMFLVFTVDDIKANLKSDAFDNEEVFFIIDRDGKNIVNTHHNVKIQNADNIFSMLPDAQGNKAIEHMRSDIQNGGSNIEILTLDKTYYVNFNPLEYNDWYLLSVVPVDTVNSTRNTVLLYVMLMCIFMLGVFILFAFYIVSAEKAKKEDLDKLLYKDELTGHYSYAKFCLEIKKQLKKNKEPAAYIIMDIDHFKIINATFGYDTGNEIICHTSNVWHELLKEGEFASRIVADRFAAFLRYENEEELLARMDVFCEKCREYTMEKMDGYIICPSIGVYMLEETDKDIQIMQNRAYMAKSLAKDDHNDFVRIYNENLKKALTERKVLEDELEHAIANRLLTVVFQPQFESDTSRICGVEALLRWYKEDGTSVSPAEFIALAEERGIIKRLDKYVFEETCKRQKEMADRGITPVDISVNVSQFSLYDSNFVSTYLNIIRETGADISHLKLEITESALFANTEAFVKLLHQLREVGFKILMDDFGTGYSSLMLLKSMPIDYLKLDKSFIDDFESVRGKAIIECVVSMAKQLGVVIIVEGVETEKQFNYVRQLGCEIIQGYYFSKPLSYEEILGKIET